VADHAKTIQQSDIRELLFVVPLDPPRNHRYHRQTDLCSLACFGCSLCCERYRCCSCRGPTGASPTSPSPPTTCSTHCTVPCACPLRNRDADIPPSNKPCRGSESIVCGALAVVVAVVAQQVLVPLHKRGTDIDARMDLTITTAQNRLIGSVDATLV